MRATQGALVYASKIRRCDGFGIAAQRLKLIGVFAVTKKFASDGVEWAAAMASLAKSDRDLYLKILDDARERIAVVRKSRTKH